MNTFDKSKKDQLSNAGLVAVPVVALATQPVFAQTNPDTEALTRMEAISTSATTIVQSLLAIALLGIAFTFGWKQFRKFGK